MDGTCRARTFNTCGTGGIACKQCNPFTTNICLPQGVCGCGSGPACTWSKVDRCEAGQCKCGSSSACGPGQQCVDGECRCTPESCDGCCDGNTCKPGNEKSQCGSNGEACQKCRHGCANGTCD